VRAGVDRFLNFGHRAWRSRGHFCQNAGIISKKNNLKKAEKNLRVVKNTK